MEIEVSHRQIINFKPEPSESDRMDEQATLCVADFILCLAKEEQLIAEAWQAVVAELLINESVQTKEITKWKTLPDDIRQMQIEQYKNSGKQKTYSVVIPFSNVTNKKEHKFFATVIRSILNNGKLQRKIVEQELNKIKNLRFLNQINRNAKKCTLTQSVEIMHREAAEFFALANAVTVKVNL